MMDLDAISLKDIRLLNSVFLAAINEALARGEVLLPSTNCRRLHPLFDRGERDFEVLKKAALEGGDGANFQGLGGIRGH